jgi:hypothetical protein
MREVCCCNCQSVADADVPPHVVRAVAEACASVNARFPLYICGRLSFWNVKLM